ncbi:UbiA family prenyltransferase [Fontisphaera persica]|uniref:UbiA family prenyltransferase n=1 Tax=Fontisphaera persica TaxID=2974023 RepID=UPI0024C06E88|nr:UbiA family prenyltransferase [Fontisphaera persica]WCJ60146.1 UbiA family prenyltransferase [Fontisphaera persica]
MTMTQSSPAAMLRGLLALGRISNLPTVWSNCLAGWLLGGAGDWNLLAVVLAGASSLYLGGVFLNDAVDVSWDRRFRPERPIPRGVVSEWLVWALSFALLTSGLLTLSLIHLRLLQLAWGLLLAIVAYNVWHKRIAWAPLLMGLCRGLLVLLAASAAVYGPDGLTVWSAVALGLYVAGLSWIARGESQGGAASYGPSVLLFAPIVLCLLVNDGAYGKQGLLLAFVLFCWLLGCLVTAYGTPVARRKEAVAKLLAGIVLVDLAAVGPAFPDMVLLFPALFLLCLVLQRFVPAT